MEKQKDDIRDLLGKIRKLQDNNKQIGLTESKDVASLLREQKRNTTLRLITEENFQEVTVDEQREEENKFKDTISKLVKFNKMKVFRKNVEWSGELVREKVKWLYSLTENNGCYISIETGDMLQLTAEVIETLKKLKGYYDVWSDEWGARLTGTPTEDGGEEGTAVPQTTPSTAPAGGTAPPESGGGISGNSGGFGV